MLEPLGITVRTLDDFPGISAIDEDQETLEGNAVKKAREVFRQANVPTLADDSGLEVFYLNDAPGVYSSRYAGPEATYSDNCKKLLRALRGVPPRRRNARFRSVLAFEAPGLSRVAQGEIHGTVIEEPRGSLGFGYDPLFVPTGHALTLAEMTADLKNSMSHRAKALESMKPILSEYFQRTASKP